MRRDLAVARTVILLALTGLGSETCSGDAPALGIQELPGQQVRLFWPQSASGYAVETADQISDAAIWVGVAEKAVAQGDNWTVTLPAPSATAYFRLKGGGVITMQTVESPAVSYLNALPQTIPAGIVKTEESLVVSFLNALPAATPAGTIATLESPPVSILNALPATMPAGTVEQVASLPVSYLNGLPQNLPPGTLMTVVSPVASYWNQ
jgi:hypothetical protein